MSRARLLARRAVAHRGLLVLVALLAATVAAALGTTVGTVRAAEVRIIHDGLTRGGDVGVVEVTTRLAPEADAGAQDGALRGHVAALFGGASYDLARQEVPDDDSDDPFVRWTLTPDVAATSVGDLRVLASGADGLLETVLADDAVAVRGATVTGDLGERAADATAAIGAAAAVALVPMLVLALAGVVAVAQVARLLAATREGEVRLLVSRGTSPAQVTAAVAAEAGVVVLGGAVVGAGAAAAVLAARGASAGSLVGTVAPSAAATAAVALLVLVVVGGVQARAAAALRLADTSGRARQAAAGGTVALVLGAAAVTLWLLRRYGSPLVPTPDGGQTDPAAAAAPALVLAAAAVLAVALLGPLSRAWAAVAARRPGTGVLAARQVAQRLTVTAVPVVLVVVAAGSVVLAAAYTGTGQHLREGAATLAAGSDVRVVAGDDDGPGPVAEYEALPGAADAAPVRVSEGAVDDVTVSVAGIPTARIAPVALGPAGSHDVAPVASALQGSGLYADNPRLPAGTEGLTLRVSGRYFVVDESLDDSGPLGAPSSWAALQEASGTSAFARGRLRALEDSTVPLTLWLADPDGQLLALDAGTLDVDLDGDGSEAHPVGPDEGTVRLAADVPPAPDRADGTPGEWTVVAFDAELPGPGSYLTSLQLSVDEMTAATGAGATTAVDLGQVDWEPGEEEPDAAAARGGRPGGGLGLAAQVGFGGMPTPFRVVAVGSGRGEVPAVLSRELADLLDVTEGERTELPLDGGDRLHVEVADVVDVVPGALHPAAALVGLGELQAASLRLGTAVPGADEMWVRALPGAGSADVARLASAAAGVAGTDGTQVTTAVGGGRSDAGGPVRQAFAVAALAAVLLALVGVGAVSVATVRGRRGEVAVLRAVGMPPRAQGDGRALELVVVTGSALVVGLVAGGLLAAATAPGLAAATITGFAVVPRAVVALAPWAALVPGLLLVAGLTVVALAVRAGVAAQAREGSYREEVR